MVSLVTLTENLPSDPFVTVNGRRNPTTYRFSTPSMEKMLDSPKLEIVVLPQVLASLYEGVYRQSSSAQRVIGTLMGYLSGDSVVVSDAFLVPFREDAVGTDKNGKTQGGIFLDKAHHSRGVSAYLALHPTHTVLGWITTGKDIKPSCVPIHMFYSRQNESGFVPSPLLPGPLLLNVDTDAADLSGTKAYRMATVPRVSAVFQFKEMHIDWETSIRMGSGSLSKMAKPETVQSLESCEVATG